MSADVDRMFRLLVATMTSRSPATLTRPFAVGDLYQDILPFRLFRRELALDTNRDYELTLMALLSGTGDYLVVDDRMADVLRRELGAAVPDAGAFRQFATTLVSIDPDALAALADEQPAGKAPSGGVQAHGTPPAPATPEQRASGAMSAVPPAVASFAPTGRAPIVAAPGESCRFCGGGLPAGRSLTYCPHCGQDQTVLHCQACGSEIEVGWKYCTTCGRGVASA